VLRGFCEVSDEPPLGLCEAAGAGYLQRNRVSAQQSSTAVSTSSLRVIRSPVDLQNAGYPPPEQVFGHFQPDQLIRRPPAGVDTFPARSASTWPGPQCDSHRPVSRGLSATGQALHGDLDDAATIRWYRYTEPWRSCRKPGIEARYRPRGCPSTHPERADRLSASRRSRRRSTSGRYRVTAAASGIPRAGGAGRVTCPLGYSYGKKAEASVGDSGPPAVAFRSHLLPGRRC
jgi:hypothetical protein